MKVRLYCHGFGDCFLLQDERTWFSMLIDCGVLGRSPEGREKLDKVVVDIMRETGGYLDVLVVTHEHWDHLSGFYDCLRSFENLKVENIWLAWTEDPTDSLALDLRRVGGRARRQLLGGLEAGFLGAGERRIAFDALQFFYPDLSVGTGLGAAKARSCRSALNNVLGLKNREGRKPRIWYLSPGSTPDVGRDVGLQFFVLGPPRDVHLLKSEPGKNDLDTFPLLGLDANEMLLSANCPFDSEWVRTLDSDKEPTPMTNPGEWSDLALKLDAHTNNTSLVLAIKGGVDGRFLLFPGDAQVGSWRSWESLTFPGVDMNRIFGNTIFYKVGHHGSHNATLRSAVERFPSHNRMASFVPVSREAALDNGWCKIPYEPILDALAERGVVVRADQPRSHRCQAGVFDANPDGLWVDFFPRW